MDSEDRPRDGPREDGGLVPPRNAPMTRRRLRCWSQPCPGAGSSRCLASPCPRSASTSRRARDSPASRWQLGAFSSHDGDTVVVRGTIDSQLEDPIDIDVRTPDPTQEERQGHGKILLDEPGAFELRVPKNLGFLELQAFQDAGGDGPTPDDPFAQASVKVASSDVDGVEMVRRSTRTGPADRISGGVPGAPGGDREEHRRRGRYPGGDGGRVARVLVRPTPCRSGRSPRDAAGYRPQWSRERRSRSLRTRLRKRGWTRMPASSSGNPVPSVRSCRRPRSWKRSSTSTATDPALETPWVATKATRHGRRKRLRGDRHRRPLQTDGCPWKPPPQPDAPDSADARRLLALLESVPGGYPDSGWRLHAPHIAQPLRHPGRARPSACTVPSTSRPPRPAAAALAGAAAATVAEAQARGRGRDPAHGQWVTPGPALSRHRGRARLRSRPGRTADTATPSPLARTSWPPYPSAPTEVPLHRHDGVIRQRTRGQ